MDLTISRRFAEDTAGSLAPQNDSTSDHVELVVNGRLDTECAEQLEAAVAEELRLGRHSIRLNLTDVGFLSSGGIRVLFNIHRAAKAAGGTCLISTASHSVTRVLTLSRLAPLLMEPRDRVPPDGTAGTAASNTLTHQGSPRRVEPPASLERNGRIGLIGYEHPGAVPLRASLWGNINVTAGDGAAQAPCVALPHNAFGLGLAAFDEEGAAAAGEMVAACGAVFLRPPRPFATADSLIGTGDLVSEIRLAAGLSWEGLPRGRAGFEPVDDEPSVRLDELAGCLLARSQANAIAFVIVGEVYGLVGAELIRPLADASAHDHPRSGIAAVAAGWLSFSREPVHAKRTALVVGVASQHPDQKLAPFLRLLGVDGPAGHAHAAVFAHRPLKRGVADLTATVRDLSASGPLAVVHLLGDPQPVLGSGQSEFVRGACWFAPLVLHEGSGERSQEGGMA